MTEEARRMLARRLKETILYHGPAGYYAKTIRPWIERNEFLAAVPNAITRIWYGLEMIEQKILITVPNDNMPKDGYYGASEIKIPVLHAKKTWNIIRFSLSPSFVSTPIRLPYYFLNFNTVQP